MSGKTLRTDRLQIGSGGGEQTPTDQVLEHRIKTWSSRRSDQVGLGVGGDGRTLSGDKTPSLRKEKE